MDTALAQTCYFEPPGGSLLRAQGGPLFRFSRTLAADAIPLSAFHRSIGSRFGPRREHSCLVAANAGRESAQFGALCHVCPVQPTVERPGRLLAEQGCELVGQIQRFCHLGARATDRIESQLLFGLALLLSANPVERQLSCRRRW